MAIMYARPSSISRGNNRSAVSAAAYRSGSRMELSFSNMSARVREKLSTVYHEKYHLLNENTREVVFVRSPGNSMINNYEIASNLLDPVTIPQSLSERVRKSDDIVWQYTTMRYLQGASVPGLAIGQKVQIPNAGQYEMYIVFSLTNEGKTLNLISTYLLIAGLILLLLITLITWVVVRQVVRPVREAARIATEFTSGDFRQRMKVYSQDEISTLGHAFNEMAESLEKQIARLENLSRVQQRFESDVSHE